MAIVLTFKLNAIEKSFIWSNNKLWMYPLQNSYDMTQIDKATVHVDKIIILIG